MIALASLGADNLPQGYTLDRHFSRIVQLDQCIRHRILKYVEQTINSVTLWQTSCHQGPVA